MTFKIIYHIVNQNIVYHMLSLTSRTLYCITFLICCIVLYYSILHYIILYFIILYGIILYFFYCIILECINDIGIILNYLI